MQRIHGYVCTHVNTLQWKTVRLKGSISHNVVLTLAYTSLSAAARSIYLRAMLSAYIYRLTGSNTILGLVSGLFGVSEVIFALPAGRATDKFRRDQVLKVSGICMLLAIVCTLFAINFRVLALVFGMQVLWAASTAFGNTALESIFADSVATGKRSFVYSAKWAIMAASGGLGPVIAVFMFLFLGNDWTLYSLSVVISVGAGAATIPAVMLFFFNDDKSLLEDTETVESIEHSTRSGEELSLAVEDVAHDTESGTEIGAILKDTCSHEDVNSVGEKRQDEDMIDTSEQEVSRERESPNSQNIKDKPQQLLSEAEARICPSEGNYRKHQPVLETLRDRLDPFTSRMGTGTFVAIIMTTSDLIIGIGAGMTVKYFPIFFIDKYNFSPIFLNCVYAVTPFLVAATSMATQKLSTKIGRVHTIIWTKLVAILCLFGIAVEGPLWSVLILYIARTSLMNSTRALSRSILMDNVEKKNRGKWNSLESVIRFSWTGSAVVGGLLVDNFNYRVCFIVTGCVYTASVMLLPLLLPFVKNETYGKEEEITFRGDDDAKEGHEIEELLETQQQSGK